MKGKLKNQKADQGKRIKASDDRIEIANLQYPIFCFKHLHSSFCLDQCSSDEKSAFIERLVKLSSLTWGELQRTQKHGFGCEKIRRSSIKKSIPTSITGDVDFFLAFRFDGKKPMIGFQNRFIFHVVYIDPKFAVYNH